jgi:hypothetical protein
MTLKVNTLNSAVVLVAWATPSGAATQGFALCSSHESVFAWLGCLPGISPGSRSRQQIKQYVASLLAVDQLAEATLQS